MESLLVFLIQSKLNCIIAYVKIWCMLRKIDMEKFISTLIKIKYLYSATVYVLLCMIHVSISG